MIASDDADYAWLAAAVTRLRQVVTTYDLGWETELHPPATWEAIDAAERAIGIPLPPSLHAFYEVHDGADLFDMLRRRRGHRQGARRQALRHSRIVRVDTTAVRKVAGARGS